MLQAVGHLHKNDVIHRDIKLENFLVGDTVDEIKIIDFGLSMKNDGSEMVKSIDFVGTVIYLAPEIL